MVILRVDAIGDYILFRNFIEAINISEKYKDYSITLIGNELWRPIAEEFDSEWIARFIWIDPKKFHKEFNYRKRVLKEIEDTCYSVLFHPTFSRDHYISEAIAKRINAKIKVASIGDISNTTSWQKNITDKNYDKLLAASPTILFEFTRNKEIVDSFIDQNSHINRPTLTLESKRVLNKKDYIILFIGGGIDFRKWSLGNWKKMIDLILSNYEEDIVIAGGPNDQQLANDLIQAFNGNKRVKNRVGKTSLVELVQLISRAQWMVSNETSAPHMAAALDTPVLVISNGNHYGRFTPYPSEMNKKYQAIFPPVVMNEKNESNRIKHYAKGSNLQIDSIEASEVITALQKLITS